MLQNSLLQCESFFVSQWKRDQLRQAFSQPDLFFDLLSLREFAIAAKTMKATSVLHELANIAPLILLVLPLSTEVMANVFRKPLCFLYPKT